MTEHVKGKTYLVNVITRAMYRGAPYKVYTIYQDVNDSWYFLGNYIATTLIPDDKLIYHYLMIASKENNV